MKCVSAADKSRPVLQPVSEDGQQERDVHVGDRVQRDVLHREPAGADADELRQVGRRGSVRSEPVCSLTVLSIR